MPIPLLRARALLLALAGLLALGSASATELKLRILGTTDVHMHLLDWDYYQDKPSAEYGLARTATLIKAARAEAKNTLLFDNGDLLQGNPLGDWVAKVRPASASRLHPAYQVLGALGVDAANLGNHDFNYGLPFLREAIAGAPFPVVNANVMLAEGGADSGRHAFTPYVILERRFTDEAGATRTVKVGVLGLVPPQIMVWDRANLSGRVVARDMVETARRLVPKLKAEGAEVVVVIPHSGFERVMPGAAPLPMAENAVARLAEVPGVDAILFGHSHGEFPGPFFADYPKADIARGTIHGVAATMPGRWGDHLGVIDLVLDDSGGGWKVSSGRAALRPVWNRAARRPLVDADPSIAGLIAEAHAGTLAYVRAEVAETTAPIQSYFAQVADDPSVQIVSQAQLAYLKRAVQGTEYEGLPLLSAAAPFKTGGRMGWNYYTDIPAGRLALRNVADLYVYPNTVRVVLLTGAQVREWLEMSAGQFNRIDPAGPAEQELLNGAFPSYNFDTLDGVSYRIDVTQPARYERSGRLVAPNARRIVDLRYQDRPVDPAARFLVVTNNYRAAGGGSFPGLDGSTTVIDAPDENRNVLVDHLTQARRIDPSADGNWRIQPVPGVKLRFRSGAGGIAHLPRYPTIRLVKDNGDGSATYELVE
jgi:2',3'-cyclic-nucleotide 2'-phosphodiesterase/3'-nucleotidase